MRLLALVTLVLLAVQDDGRLKGIVDRLNESVQKAKTSADRRAALKASLAELDALIASTKDAQVGPRACTVAAQLCTDLEDERGAAERLLKILDRWPDFEAASSVKLAAADSLWASGDDAGAREAYAQFVKSAGGDERAFQARLHIAQTFLTEGRTTDGVAALEAVRQDYKGRREEWSAMMLLSQGHQFAEKLDAARGLLEDVIRNSTELSAVERAKHVLANLLWIGKPAPSFSEKDLKGAPFDLAAHQGRVVVLYFFSSDFQFAEIEARVLKRLRRTVPSADLSILGVCIERDRTKAERMVRELELDWPVCVDGGGYDGKLAKLYEVRDPLPMVVVIDRKGLIRFINPLFSGHGRELSAVAARLAAEK